MNTPATHAAQRVDELAARNRPAAELARYASLAVRIDTALLRRLRLALLPGADASAEADLWFSGLSESRGDEGFVLDEHVAALLRDQLAAEPLGNGRRALDVAWAHTEAAHAAWPESLRLEEKLTYLALGRGDRAAEAIEEALRPAMVALASGEQRAVEVARWAVRALPRLPAAARDTEAVLALLLAALAVIGMSPASLAAGDGRALPDRLGWLMPRTLGARTTELFCELSPHSLLLRVPRSDDPAGARLTLPTTRPLLAELSWSVDGARTNRLQAIQPGVPVPLPAGWRELRLRTLAGAVYWLDATGQVASASLADARRACVTVICGNSRARGVRVSSGHILTALHVVHEAVWSESSGNARIEIVQGSSRVEATLLVADARVDLALLALDAAAEQGLAEALVMPIGPADPALGEPVMLLVDEVSGASTLAGRVQAVDVTTRLDRRQYSGLTQIVLEGDASQRMTFGMSGSPVMYRGAMVGVARLRGGAEIYASSRRIVKSFLDGALRRAAREPVVFMSFAPRATFDPRGFRGAPLGRVMQALHATRLRPWLTAETQSERSEAYIDALNAAAGAVVILTPDADGTGPKADRDLSAIAFRRWIDPLFPVALVTSGAQLPHLPRSIQHVPAIEADSLDDASLWQRLQEVLEGGDSEPEPASDEAFMQAASPQAIEAVEFASMRMLPGGETLEVLRRAARAEPGQRAVYLNAMPVQYARLLLKRAWFPGTPPPHVVIRDQQWPADDDVGALVAQIVKLVNAEADGVERELGWVLAQASAAYVVIFATRPFPNAPVVEMLRIVLPGALLFFLGTDRVEAPVAAAAGVTLLPPLRDAGESITWFQQYKQLMDQAAPRERVTAQPAADDAPMVSQEQLRRVMPKVARAALDAWFVPLNEAMDTYRIDTPPRRAAFLAIVAHETSELRHLEEIWGPTDAQRRYEPPGDLAKRLGNVAPGDGKRFRGRGLIAITGRANYASFGQELGVDLVAHPELAATPEIACRIAGVFWQRNNLNELMDKGTFIDVVRRISGGVSGLASRQAYHERALQVLAASA